MTKYRSGRPVMTRMSAAVIVASLAGVTFAATGPQIVGITAAVVNDVRIGRAPSQPHAAILRERVALADQVLTGQKSQLQVLLLDKSVFTVGANSRLTIDRFVYDPNGQRSFSASVAKGAFRFMSGKPDRRGSSSINTPVATIGIRGTIVDGIVGADAIKIVSGEREIARNVEGDPETASLVILRGPGPRTQGDVTVGMITVSAGGKEVTLDRPLLAAYVPRRGAEPIGPFTISRSGLSRVQEFIFPGLADRGSGVSPGAATSRRPAYVPYRPRQPRRLPPFPMGGEPEGNAAVPRFDLPNMQRMPARGQESAPPPAQEPTQPPSQRSQPAAVSQSQAPPAPAAAQPPAQQLPPAGVQQSQAPPTPSDNAPKP